MTDKPVLYTYFRSSASWRVRIALAYKGIDHEVKFINLLKSEQKGEDYLKINPMGHVPALSIHGKILTQSVAILEYIEEEYPEKSLLPLQSLQRHKVREICEIIGSGIQPLQNNSVQARYSDDVEKKIEWAQFWISKGLQALEQILRDCSGKYCVGDELTLADVFLSPQVYSAHRFNVDMSPYPLISKINDNLETLEAFKTAHAFAQPDCPPELKPAV